MSCNGCYVYCFQSEFVQEVDHAEKSPIYRIVQMDFIRVGDLEGIYGCKVCGANGVYSLVYATPVLQIF